MITKLLSKHTDGREVYQPVYNEFFTDAFCVSVRNILEIGIQYGIGLRAWLATFPEARVYGYESHVDPMLDDIGTNPRLEVHSGLNSAIPQHVETFFDRIQQVKMDVIIDDADHQETSQLATLRNFWPHVAPGGIYVLEDTGPRETNDSFVRRIEAILEGGKVHVRKASHLSGLIVIVRDKE
jgi:cephalosporin hydroxylase